LRAEGRYRDALACFEHALEIDPKYRDAKRARADMLRVLTM
jgi:tetratricopeptide (TPR) repeat protein